jgi:hypothetical protein
MSNVIADAQRAAERYEEFRKNEPCMTVLHPRERPEWDAYWAVQQRAYEAFGKLNGWGLVNLWFPLKAIGHPERTWDRASHHFEDAVRGTHRFYRKGHRSIALVVEPPLRWRSLDELRPELDALAAQYGLRWSVPPVPSATIEPVASLFIVMTLPDIEVVWLPEQMGTA